MKQEFSALIKELDAGSAETQMALHCAPLITGLKVSNLLILKNSQVKYVQRLIRQTRISCYMISADMRKTVLLLYRLQPLYRYLNETQVRGLLWQLSYREFSFDRLLHVFAARYRAYLCGRTAFPHEMGLFLGYPAEDVLGFMKNNGQNFLCSGYWKVYQDKAGKLLLFYQYDRAKELLVTLAARGIRMADVLKYA